MRSRQASAALLFFIFVCSSILASAQSTPVTGIPPFSSTTSSPSDVIDLANLNVHLSIPVFSRPGKGISFSYSLNYDSLVWQVIKNSGGQYQWAPMPSWGWSGSTQPTTGYVTYTYSDTTVQCGSNNVEKETWSNWTYYDSLGSPHLFGGSVYLYDDPGCGSSSPSMTVRASDNSGYQIHLGPVTTGEQNVPTTITGIGGVKISPPSLSSSGSGTVQDTNGNVITASASGAVTMTDTLNTVALTVSGITPNNPPTCGPDLSYSYTAPNNQQVSVKVHYLYYVAQTNFEIPWIQEWGPIGVCLVNKVTLPDTSSYTFSYESTVGNGISGKTTGRIASVTLPTGGVINYSYDYPNWGTTCYNSSNCMMPDGSPYWMQRWQGAEPNWTYARYLQPPGTSQQQTQTTVIDPTGNETDLNFSGIYETLRDAYEGNGSSKSLLKQTYACYNGTTGWQNCQPAVVSAPITSKTVVDSLDLTGYSSYSYTYDGNGLLTQESDYDYTSGNPIIRSMITHYNTALCSSYNICDHPANIQVTDGHSNSKAYTTYAYDEGGNTFGSVTSINRSTSGSTGGPFLTQQYRYNSGGTLAYTTDVNGTVTNYSYAGGSCNSAFPTSVSTAGFSTVYTYNCTGGVTTSVTDPNGAFTSTAYSDPYFWRPASTTDPLNNTTYYNYYTVRNAPVSAVTLAGQTESVMNFNSVSTQDVLTTLDVYGRPKLTQKRQSQGSANFDTTQLMYDWNGRVQWALLPFVASAGQPSSGGLPATGYTYDGLGRPTTVVDWDQLEIDYLYHANDVYIRVKGQPNGENPKSRQYEYNAIGLLTSVCEVTSATGSGPCGQVSPAGGFSTSYSWDALGNLTNVSQSGQTRAMTYDGLSRLKSEIDPEVSTSATSYYYDSDSSGHCSGTYNGDKVARVDAASRSSCYQYDSLHRLTFVSYPGSGMPNKYFFYDWGSWAGLSFTNPKGHLIGTQTWTGNNQDASTSLEAFGYDARGQVTDHYQLSQNSAGWYHVHQGYTPTGARGTIQAFLDNGNPLTHNFGYDTNEGEGRYQGLTDHTNSQTVACCTQYNAAGQPNQVQMIGSYDIFSYDSYSGRMTQFQSKDTTTHSQTGALTWNANGTLHNLAVTDSFNSDRTETCTYVYDDLTRLSSVECGATKWGQSFSYDVFGNINKSVLSGHTGVSFTQSYNAGTNRISGFSYDSVGDLKLDSSYAYDVEGRPVTIGGTNIIYDAFNRAVEMNTSSSHQQILYDAQGAKLAYMSAQGVQKYMLPLANGVQAVFNSGGISYYRHADWLGSSRIALYTTGLVYSARAYAPYGEVEDNTETGQDRIFTGQSQDITPGTTGIYDFLYRQQASAEGRWLTPDPAGLAAVDITNPQTWNRYAYVGNNPLSNVDRLGLFANIVPPPSPSIDDIIDWGGFGGGPLRLQLLPLDGPGEGRGGRGIVVDPSQQPPDDPNRPPLRNHNGCGDALGVTGKEMDSVQRAFANWSTLDGAANGNWDGAALLAAIGVRESGFSNGPQIGGGPGYGVFQVTTGPTTGITQQQSGNLAWSANYAENLLKSNGKYLARRFPNFNSGQLLQATVASYNMNPYKRVNFSGNPDRIDVGTTGGNYGSNVLQIMENCF